MNQEMVLPDGTLILLIHYLFRTPAGTTSLEGEPLVQGPETCKIACSPNLLEMCADANRPWPWRRTDDPRAATCPLCKETPQYKKAMALLKPLERK